MAECVFVVGGFLRWRWLGGGGGGRVAFGGYIISLLGCNVQLSLHTAALCCWECSLFHFVVLGVLYYYYYLGQKTCKIQSYVLVFHLFLCVLGGRGVGG